MPLVKELRRRRRSKLDIINKFTWNEVFIYY